MTRSTHRHETRTPSDARVGAVAAAGSIGALASLFAVGSIASTAGAGGEACRAAAAAQDAARAGSPAPTQAEALARPVVDLAICLDTSGSMQGLIDTARARIWDVVSDLATAKPVPRLRVALVTFGNDGHKAENGWTNLDQPFTEDLDMVSMKLFALTTNGGTELVGRAVDSATRSLEWTPGDAALRIIVVAGNESADQDAEIRYGDASRRAIEKGILVNSIYCGDPADQLAPAWREVAKLADGQFAAINQAEGAVAIATPYDDRLAVLSSELNGTYLPYGARGEWSAGNQSAQDSNASNMSTAVAAQRCVAKGGEMYNNRGWDLVDACKEGSFKLESVKTEELPEPMRAMTPEQRIAHVASMASRRAEIQKQVQEVGAERERFLVAERARLASGGPRFESVIRDSVRAQAQAKGMQFPEAAPPAMLAAPQDPAAVPVATKDGC